MSLTIYLLEDKLVTVQNCSGIFIRKNSSIKEYLIAIMLYPNATVKAMR